MIENVAVGIVIVLVFAPIALMGVMGIAKQGDREDGVDTRGQGKD